jgi:hypothetical protein
LNHLSKDVSIVEVVLRLVYNKRLITGCHGQGQ